jgi:acetyltransferase-like isoleucine patch superfamily enzyme
MCVLIGAEISRGCAELERDIMKRRPNLLTRLFIFKVGIPPSVWVVNAIFQRIFRLNASVNFQVNFTSTVIAGDKIILGRGVWKSFALSGNCYIQAGNGVYIGDDTIFAPGVKIISANHGMDSDKSWEPSAPIRIGNRCWLGANSIVLPGVQLGDDTIVGAGAVVTRSFPGRSVLVGVPARQLRV